MKKSIILSLVAVFAMVLIAFAANGPVKKHTTKEKKKEVVAPACNCATPSFTSVTTSGGTTTISWTATPGALMYSFGGYYHTGPGFSYCPSTNSISIPYNGGGTVQVRAICGGTCLSATCSSGTGGPRVF